MKAQIEEFKQHALKSYNADLEALMNHVLELGGLVEKQLDTAVQAMQSASVDKAQAARQLDRLINEVEQNTDQAAIRILARHQPAASDLRLIVSSLRIGIDLERIGDEVVKLARMVERFDRYGEVCVQLKAYPKFYELVEMARVMLKKALDAYARLDMQTAVELLEDEEKADAIYDEVMNIVIEDFNGQAQKDVRCFLEFVSAIKAVERATDHLANVGESVIYVINGRDVRSADHDMIESLRAQLERDED
ncbi:phosphate signaling complex protein PhoU [Sulfurivirga sp.]|uniref:phosphate signaling complex protein PhoU n=1 Tax=Sulfurivirga sp. TaxID=2614236 RepID=UPI0025E10CF3|nr:phosphate signaling complex protein PhoU [Sulfurivirga sp.]